MSRFQWNTSHMKPNIWRGKQKLPPVIHSSVVSGQWLYNFIKLHTVQSHKKAAASSNLRIMISYGDQAESRHNNTTVINKKSIFFSLAQLGVKAEHSSSFCWYFITILQHWNIFSWCNDLLAKQATNWRFNARKSNELIISGISA